MLLLDCYVVNGAVIHQAKRCRVHDNESYRDCAEVDKRVVELPSEGCWCSLQSRPLEIVVISATCLTLRAPQHVIYFQILPDILVTLASPVIWVG